MNDRFRSDQDSALVFKLKPKVVVKLPAEAARLRSKLPQHLIIPVHIRNRIRTSNPLQRRRSELIRAAIAPNLPQAWLN